jgi:hypothetical protein
MMRSASRTKRNNRKASRPFEGISTGPTLHYAVVPKSIPFVNDGSFWSGHSLVKRAPRLAITQDRLRRRVELHFCNSRWRILHGISAPSVSKAKHLAEQFYPGLDEHWVDLSVTAAAGDRYMKRLRREQGCSFCDRAPGEHGVSQIQVRQARICADCVAEFYKDLRPSPKKASSRRASRRTRQRQGTAPNTR